MRVTVDTQTDALYFRLNECNVVESEEVQPGVILDYDANDQVVGVEFLHVSTRAGKDELSMMQFQTA
jgi:uncharacterized protein YuzE